MVRGALRGVWAGVGGMVGCEWWAIDARKGQGMPQHGAPVRGPGIARVAEITSSRWLVLVWRTGHRTR